jgi:hypothetical protein
MAEERFPLTVDDEFFVAGVRYEKRSSAAARMGLGDEVQLVRVLDNPHSPCAIEIRTKSNELIGFMPNEQARYHAQLLDAEYRVEASVYKIWKSKQDGQIVPIIRARFRAPAGDAGVRPLTGVDPASRNATRANRPVGCLGRLVICLGVGALLWMSGA